MSESQKQKLSEAIELGHEARDVNARAVFVFVAILLFALASILFALIGLFDWFDHDQKRRTPRVAAPTQRLTGPRLQAAPPLELARLQAQENQELNQFAWIDEPQGIASIPIAEAMSLVAQNGFPDWPQAAGQSEPQPGSEHSGQRTSPQQATDAPPNFAAPPDLAPELHIPQEAPP